MGRVTPAVQVMGARTGFAAARASSLRRQRDGSGGLPVSDTGERSNEPEILEVRAGLFGRTRLLISVEEVAEIAAEDRRIILNDPPELLSALTK